MGDKTPKPTKKMDWPSKKPTEDYPQWQTEKPTKWSSDKPKYSMRYADAAHDYKEWNTPKPRKKYNHWERTPRPTEHKQWNTPKPSKHGQWEKENDYKEEMKRAAESSYYGHDPYERRYD